MDPRKEIFLNIAETIKEVFHKGFKLDGKTLHYIDSTYSNPSKAEIEMMLAGESDSEKETLLKLLFTPDESVHCLIEKFLEDSDIARNDIEKIAEYLSAHEIESEIIFPDERGRICVKVPPSILIEFINHLNMTVKFSEKLAGALEFILSERLRLLAKVKIRNSTKQFAGTRLDFLTDLFEKMGNEDECVFTKSIETAIRVLENTDERSDIYQAFMLEKAACFRSLIDSERFKEQLEKSNIETLLLQGVRPVSVDKDAVMRKMELIDRICLAVFGKTEYYGNSFSCMILNSGEK
jgi:hypothetical protein